MPIGSSPTIEQLLTLADVARSLNISQISVRRLQQRRRIGFHKVGGSIRFTKNDIESFLAKTRVETIG